MEKPIMIQAVELTEQGKSKEAVNLVMNQIQKITTGIANMMNTYPEVDKPLGLAAVMLAEKSLKTVCDPEEIRFVEKIVSSTATVVIDRTKLKKEGGEK